MAETRAAWGNRATAEPVLSLTVFVVLLAGFIPLSPPSERPTSLDRQSADTRDFLSSLDSLGGYFVENRGQVNGLVRYYSTGNPSVAFRDDGVMFVVRHVERSDESKRIEEGSSSREFAVRSAFEEKPIVESFAYLLRFEGANPVTPVGKDRLPFNSNFLIGNEPGRWRSDVPNYREAVYENLYEGIDLVYRQSKNGVKYEFAISPGTDPAAIKFRYEGIESIQMDEGDIVVSTAMGEMRDSAPYSFQDSGEDVRCGFVARGALAYGFDCQGRDPASRLVIDPLVYSTFLGGTDNDLNTCQISLGDYGHAIAVDATGSAYITGVTCSLDFPITAGSFDTDYNKYSDAFIAKLNPAGSMLLYSTYLGAEAMDWATSIAVDSTGSAYITGATTSAGFPVTPGAFDTSFDEFNSIRFTEAFVTKLNPQGNGLTYSTFLGGKCYEWAWSIAVDSSGNAYVTGETNGTDFPTTPDAVDRIFNSYYGTYDYPDVFVTKFNAAGSALVYSTFVGGEGFEWGSSVQVDAEGNAYVTGSTNSAIFPRTFGAFDRTLTGPLDGFLFKVNAAGSALAYSTYLGGGGWEMSNSVALDSSGNAYVTGYSNSTDFPVTPGAFRTTMVGGRDAFVTKLNPSGSGLVYSTFLGGNSMIDYAFSIALNSLGDAFVTGLTYSGDFPTTKDAFDTVFSDREGFVSELDATGSSLLYSTFLGGRGSDDRAEAVTVDLLGIAYVTGYTNSTDFPVTSDAFDRSFNGVRDAFVVKLIPVTKNDPADLAVLPVDITFTPPSPVRVGDTVTIRTDVHNMGGTNASNVAVRFFDGPPGPSNQIGTDQTIPFVERFFGLGDAAVAWTAGPIGTHDICVVVDPVNTIVEMREDNNQACSTIEVLQLQPDLTLSVSDISLVPAPPYVPGTFVQVTATIHNIGDAASGGTVVRFHDGVPPSVRIGSDQALGPLSVGGTGTASVTWTASPPGNHRICVGVDPDNVVAEMDETNNMACKDAKVLTPTDLAVSSLLVAPPSPLPYGSLAWVNVTIVNWGEIAAGPFDVLLFDDANLNSLPDASEDIARSSQPDLPGRFVRVVPFTWTAVPGGDRSICGYVDPPPGIVPESNENNNMRCSPVTVEWQVITKPDYVPVQPQPPSPFVTALSSSVDLSVHVLNRGNATGNRTATLTFYDASSPSSPFATASVLAIPAGGTSGPFTATWTSPALPGTCSVSVDVDYYDDITEWDETNNAYTWTIEVVSGPVTSLVIGSPNYTSTVTHVKSSTPLDFLVADRSGTGIRYTNYSIDGGMWNNYTATGTFFLAGEGVHTIDWYSVDFAGNVENVSSIVLRVDNTPPATVIEPETGEFHTATLFTLTATDGGSGVKVMRYRIDGGSPTDYSGGFTLPEGNHNVSHYSIDNLDNTEQEKWLAVTVQAPPPPNTPPTVTVTSPIGGEEWLKGSSHYIIWTMHDDQDADDNLTVYINYTTGGIAFSIVAALRGPESFLWTLPDIVAADVVVNITAIDTGGMKGWSQSGPFTIKVPTQPPSVEANYKPLVALVFAVILTLVGLWSSKRRPWKNGMEKIAVAKAFSIASLPFVLAEAATGVASFLAGQPSIPPLVGPGTAIDLAILLSGVVVAILRTMRKRSLEAGETNST